MNWVNAYFVNPGYRHSGECQNPVEKTIPYNKEIACPLDTGIRQNDGTGKTLEFKSMRLPRLNEGIKYLSPCSLCPLWLIFSLCPL